MTTYAFSRASERGPCARCRFDIRPGDTVAHAGSGRTLHGYCAQAEAAEPFRLANANGGTVEAEIRIVSDLTPAQPRVEWTPQHPCVAEEWEDCRNADGQPILNVHYHGPRRARP